MSATYARPWAAGLLFAAAFLCEPAAQAQFTLPRFRPPVAASRWQLGVTVQNIPHGSRITRVVPASVAQQAGLAVGDLIMAVNGAPVGIVHGRLRDMGDVLNQQAGVHGHVTLRVRNGRTGRIQNVPVRLAPAGGGWHPGPSPGPTPPWPSPPNLRRQIADLYVQYLRRPARPDEIQYWVQQAARPGGLRNVTLGILASDEYFDRNRNNPNIFVRSLFRDVTGRRPSDAEVQSWVDRFFRQFRGDRTRFVREFLRSHGLF
jgi:hypothetical protein